MSQVPLAVVTMLTIVVAATAFVGIGSAYSYTVDGVGVFSDSNSGCLAPNIGASLFYDNDAPIPLYADVYITSVGRYGADPGNRCASPLIYAGVTYQGYRVVDAMPSPVQLWHGTGYRASSAPNITVPVNDYISVDASNRMTCQAVCDITCVVVIGTEQIAEYTVSGDFGCVDSVALYIKTNSFDYIEINYTDTSPYDFGITDGCDYMLMFSNGMYYNFTCTGDEVFDYDACTWVYGYTCGIDTIKLYKADGGWVLTDTESPGVSWSVYEMPIINGNDYLISFLDGGTVCHNETFSCTGNHVLIDFDRCNWVWPPSPWGPPIIIYLTAGYDYNIVVFKDEHGNFIENSQLAIYDTTDGQYIQRWADAAEGYTLLGARFDTDHEVKLMLRTFDGIFTLDTDHPANGTSLVGDENITATNWTIPIKYNLNVLPIDTYGVPLFDVFCGLSEYTPLNPGSFWGMDLSDQGYVAVTNCSGFSRCDIVAEKEGYADYRIEALNWTSKSAMVKDYRHNVVMEEE